MQNEPYEYKLVSGVKTVMEDEVKSQQDFGYRLWGNLVVAIQKTIGDQVVPVFAQWMRRHKSYIPKDERTEGGR